MNSSNSATGQGPSVAPPTRSFLVLLADNSRLRVTDRDLAIQLRQERNATLQRLRQARAEAKALVAERIGEDHIRREFMAREREADVAIRRMSKQVRIKPELRRASQIARSVTSRRAYPRYARIVHTRKTNSALARRDGLGREGIMLRIRYVRAGGKHASPGCLHRHWRYIARENAVTLDSEGRQIVMSNLGDTLDDVAVGLDVQETVLRAMRKNAKLGFRMIGAFPYGLPVDARRAVLQRIGDELFGNRGLPWTAAAHDSDPGAQFENPHFHIDYGALPMSLQADGSYIVSNDLRTDLDGEDGLRFIRHTVARILTEVAQEYGLDRSFTALSYRERGMDVEGGEHIGQAATAAHRRGEYVAAVQRNELKRRGSDAREKAKKVREWLKILERLKQESAAIPRAPTSETVPALETSPPVTTPLISLPTVLDSTKPCIDVPAPPRIVAHGKSVPPEPPVRAAVRLFDLPARKVSAPSPPVPVPITSFCSVIDPPIFTSAINRLPPAENAIARNAPNLRDVPSLHGLGGTVPHDPDAESTASQINILVAEQKRHREAGVAAAHRLTSKQADEAAFEILRTRDEWLHKDEQGRYALSREALHESGLSVDDLQTASAQEALAEMALAQVARLAPLTEDTSGEPVMHLDDETVCADSRFSKQLQDDVRRWGRDANFRQFIEQRKVVVAPASTAPPPPTPVTNNRRWLALTTLFAKISDERLRVRLVDGAPVVDATLIAKYRLEPADLQQDAVRKRLEELARQQNGELSVIASYVRQAPHHIVPDGDGWLLAEDAPSDVRELSLAWRRDAEVQMAFGRLAPVRASVSPQTADPSPLACTSAGWDRARISRQRAMAESDEAERLDGCGMERPGRPLARPAIVRAPAAHASIMRFLGSGFDR